MRSKFAICNLQFAICNVFDLTWFLVWAVASSAWCVTAASQLSATFDEPIYLERGLERWRTSSHAGLLKLGTMPLPADVQTLPLYLWERIRGKPFDREADFEQLLPWARATTLGFWWLLLGYGMLMGRLLAGSWGGRAAVAVLAGEPNLLAHAALATTDIAVSACVLALGYHFLVGREGGWFRRLAVPAAWYAAAVLAKASGLVFGPLCLFALEVQRLRGVPPFRACFREFAVILGGGLLLVFLYCGSDWQPQPSFVAFAHKLPDGPAARAMVYLSEHLCIFSNAGEGLVRQIKHNMHGHGTYLLGHTHPRALWYYFPVALAIKLSVPLLAAPLLLAALRPRVLTNGACITAAALLVFSLNCRVQIGIRLILPLVVFAAIGLAAAMVQAIHDLGTGWRGRLLTAGGWASVAWTAAAAVAVWPHGLSYVNPLWGGPERGYELVSDANYDWGQGLKELAAWRQTQGIDELDVWYFGSDPAYKRPPWRLLPLHVLPVETDPTPWLQGRRLAVSTTLLYGSAMTEAHARAAAYLRDCRPVARTTTFFIYDFTAAGARPASAGR